MPAELVAATWRVSASRGGADVLVEGLSAEAAVDLAFDLLAQGAMQILAEERATRYEWADGKGWLPATSSRP